tara:strand:- start:685 stop:897 length:213 start_codon:yes stop_codon:yes gene_type:complete
VSQLGTSLKERIVSRICFYLLVALVVWTGNRSIPVPEEMEEKKWADRGVAPVFIAVPIADLPFDPATFSF